MKKMNFRSVLIVLTVFYALVITLLSVLNLSSIENPVELPYVDKIVHFCFYFGLNLLLLSLLRTYNRSSRWLNIFFVCLVTIAYSFCLEVVQDFVGREFDLYDLLANSIGAVVALCVFETKWVQIFLERRIKA